MAMTSQKAQLHYDAWPTAWGPVGAVTGPKGLRGLILPHYPLDQLLQLLAWDFPKAVRDAAPFEQLRRLTGDYFNARVVDFLNVRCDMPSPDSFAGKVLRACREIPPGETMSYHALAIRIGRDEAARAVAAALGKNKLPLVIPCHRVIYADGRAGGFSAAGGAQLKQRMLAMERVSGSNQ